MHKIQVIDPIHHQGWDRLISTNKCASIFHSSAWAKVLQAAYGYKPLYFIIYQNQRLSGVIPIMEVNSFLTGRRGVSLPFSDCCEPIATEENICHDLLQYIIDYGKKRNWRYIEIRGGEKFFNHYPSSSRYNGHVLEFKQSEKNIFSSLRSSTRRNIRKAEKKGVRVTVRNTIDSVDAFFKLHCLTRKNHGLPPQPFYFFKNIYKYLIAENKGRVILADFKDKIIAGAVCFNFGGRGIYKYGASDRTYQHLRANNLVMWKAIQWHYQNGLQTFEMGRTELTNKGLDQFKRGWGARKQQILYYKYDLQKCDFVVDHSGVEWVRRRCAGKIPVFLLKQIGSLAYKHAG